MKRILTSESDNVAGHGARPHPVYTALHETKIALAHGSGPEPSPVRKQIIELMLLSRPKSIHHRSD